MLSVATEYLELPFFAVKLQKLNWWCPLDSSAGHSTLCCANVYRADKIMILIKVKNRIKIEPKKSFRILSPAPTVGADHVAVVV